MVTARDREFYRINESRRCAKCGMPGDRGSLILNVLQRDGSEVGVTDGRWFCEKCVDWGQKP